MKTKQIIGYIIFLFLLPLLIMCGFPIWFTLNPIEILYLYLALLGTILACFLLYTLVYIAKQLITDKPIENPLQLITKEFKL